MQIKLMYRNRSYYVDMGGAEEIPPGKFGILLMYF